MPDSGKTILTANPSPSEAPVAEPGGISYKLQESAFHRLNPKSQHTPLTLKRALLFSAVLHVISPPILLIVALLSVWLISTLLHVDLLKWLHPQSKPDLEFTLVQDTHAKQTPEKPQFKSAFAQNAGGKRQRHLPPKPKTAEPAIAPKPQPKQATNISPPQPATKEASSKPVAIATPGKTTTPKKVMKTTEPNPSQASPDPKTSLENENSMSSDINPQDGKAPTPGVDVLQDANFGPFMADLEKKIKHNWVPPRGAESRKVRLMLYLQRDGYLAKVETLVSSGNQEADEAAVAAAEASVPFMAFPPQIKEDVLPVEFTFDYNVLNPKNSRRTVKN